VVIRQANNRVTLTAAFPEVTLELACATPETGTEVLVVPMAVLDPIGGAAPDLVQLEGTGGLTGAARWTEKGAPRTHAIELILPGKQHDPPPRPADLRPVPSAFLAALHEAGRTASREDGRYALSRVQVRGATGQVIATDGKAAVVFGGFAFPFADDLLVPAIPLFGSPELRDDAAVRVGRTPKHLVVSAGDWTAWLGAAAGKFPDVAAVVPRHAPTAVALDLGDAARLLARLPALPGRGHEHRPVTLDAVGGGTLAVRGHEGTGAADEAALVRSPVTGPAALVVLDRRALARMLALGCTQLRFTPGKALVGAGAGVTVLVAPLDPDLAVRSQPHEPSTPKPETEPKRSNTMKPPETNGHSPNGRHDPPTEALDPLVAAEDLRAALGEALSKAGRLVAALKAGRKEKKALVNLYTSLKQLNLDQP
jgi:hypothetical protein